MLYDDVVGERMIVLRSCIVVSSTAVVKGCRRLFEQLGEGFQRTGRGLVRVVR